MFQILVSCKAISRLCIRSRIPEARSVIRSTDTGINRKIKREVISVYTIEEFDFKKSVSFFITTLFLRFNLSSQRCVRRDYRILMYVAKAVNFVADVLDPIHFLRPD